MWRCRKINSLKNNKKGMTLIEVIVAMGILAVVVTPTLRIFASSSSVNLRSKQRQRATVAGESVMESFKAYNMQTLCSQFGKSKFAGVSSFKSMKVDAYYPNPTDPANPIVKSPFHVNGALNQDAVRYRFEIQGVKAETTGGKQTYDIEIEAVPHESSVFRFENPNTYSDAIISIDESIVDKNVSTGDILYVTTVLDKLKDKAKENYINAGHGAGYSVDSTASKISDLKRTIVVTVTDDATTKAQTVSYSITYNCKVTLSCKYTNPTTGAVTSVSPDPSYTVEYKVVMDETAPGDAQYMKKVYDNSVTLANKKANERLCKLDNIYLYYFPVNKTVYGDNCEDLITIEAPSLNGTLYCGSNEEDRMAGKGPLNLFIARQMPTTLSPTQLMEDSSYVFSVTGNLPATGGGKMNVYHNFCEKFSDGYTSAYESIDAANARFTGNFNSLKEIGKDLMKDINLIYDLDVKIYEDVDINNFDTGNLLAEFTGTKNE